MTPELLAPAGGPEALQAAVCAGADAVYLGAASFGARAAVGFGPEELKQAIRFAHLHGRRVYVTVNTLVKDGEWEDLRAQLRLLRDLRADAVLVQDLGVCRLCRAEFPELTLHASTQMSLHTPSGIRWAARNGFRRVVLNREATLDDIRAAIATGVEIEVFAHGALCVSVSGQCALSASLGERSGNRGRCAQPCRLPYRYRGEEKAWLSPADLCALNVLPELARAGVASLKLEGRLKRPEYVYIVTDVYRRALDRLNSGRASASETDMDALKQIFCRGRFTRGYAGGCQDTGILDPEHTAHQGIRIGRIEQVSRRGGAVLARFVPERTLHDQDGLTVGEDKCIYTGPDVPAGQQATLRLHRPAEAGTPVQRTESAEQLNAAGLGFGDEALKRLRLPFSAVLYASVSQPARLALSSGGVTVHTEGPVCEAATHHPLSEATVRQALGKTGDAPFFLSELTVHADGAYLSSAQLNALRREGLKALEDAVISRYEAEMPAPLPAIPVSAADSSVPPAGRFYVRTDSPEEIPSLLDAGADRVLFSPRDTTAAALSILRREAPSDGRVILALPPMADDDTLRRLKDLAGSWGCPVAADNAGQLESAPDICMTTEGVPVFNAETEHLLRDCGVESAVLSPELSGKEIAGMPPPVLERILCVYGRQRLMLLNHCPERVYRGLTSDRAGCRRCENGTGVLGQCLTDRKGLSLPLIPYRTERGCVVRLYGGKPVSLLNYMDELRKLHISFLISFTDEPAGRRQDILRAFISGGARENNPYPGKFLTGIL